MENKEGVKMLIENADLMQMRKIDERIEIAKAVLPALIIRGTNSIISVRRALEIADELMRQNNQQREEINGARNRETKG